MIIKTHFNSKAQKLENKPSLESMSIYLNDKQIAQKDVVKYLDNHLVKKLIWHPHIK